MNVLIHRAGAVWLLAGAKISRVCSLKIMDNPTCLWKARLPSTTLCHLPVLQDLPRGRVTGIGFLHGAVVRNGREHGVPGPVNSGIVSLICFRGSPASPGER
jgi:hypothetical protein